VVKLVEQSTAKIVTRNGVIPESFAALSNEFTDGSGFDDIVMLDPRSASLVGAVAAHIARRGTMNMVGTSPLDGLVDTDVGRLHYDYIAFIGNTGPDIAASYGEKRNRCELSPGGATVFIGAGGPMGQMHVQRAIELPDGPKTVIATEVSDQRLDAIRERFAPLAEKNGRTLLTFNPLTNDRSLHDFVMEKTDGKGADDVVVSVPIADVMAEGDTLMNENGMLVFFAGVPNGTMAPMNLNNVYLNNSQYTGTSGLTLDDQRQVLDQAFKGTLSPGRSVGAIGGMQVTKEGIEAVINGKYAGKIVIFPQIDDLPLIGLDELKDALPEVAEKLEPGNMWTKDAEEALFEKFWKG
jgi:D-arabinose 1-dehydrogenase-like Zn-dependent alcohol dehydrogenase